MVQKQLVMRGDKCWLSKLRTTLNESECGACFWDLFVSVPNFRPGKFRGLCFRVDSEYRDEVSEIRWEADFAKDCASIYDRKWWSEVSLVGRKCIIIKLATLSVLIFFLIQKYGCCMHGGNNNKCRSYALFKSQALRQESYLPYVSDVSKLA